MTLPEKAAIPSWKRLLRLGEQLAQQATTAAQIGLVTEAARDLLNAQARIWLSPGIYPLPDDNSSLEFLFSPQDAPAHVVNCYQRLTIRCPECEDGRAVEFSPTTVTCSIAAPLAVNENLLGVLLLERPPEAPFSPTEIDLLEEFAGQVAAAIEIARQETLKNWRYEQLMLVRSVSQQISNILDLDTLCIQVTRLIQQQFGFYYVSIFTHDSDANRLRLRASAHQIRERQPTITFSVEMGYGMIGAVALTGEELLAPNVNDEPRYRHIDGLPETQSEVTLPLKVEGRVLGVLDIQSDRLNAFHQNDLIVLRALADNIALAVEGARLYNSLSRRAKQIQALFEVSQALSSILELDRLLDAVVLVVQRRFGFPFIHIYTVHNGRRLVIYRAGTGSRSQAMRRQEIAYPMDSASGMIPYVARTGRTVAANDVLREPLYRPSELPPYNTAAELTVPLMFDNQVIGILDIQSDRRNAFEAEDISLFESLAAAIAVAINNAQLYRSEQWRRQVADSFRDVAYRVATSTDLSGLLDSILTQLEKNLPCEGAAIWLVQDNLEGKQTLHLAALHGAEPARIAAAMQSETGDQLQSLLRRTLEAPAPIIRSMDEPAGPLGLALGYPPGYSSIASSLRAGNQTIGLVALAHPTAMRYGGEAQSMLATFSSYAAVAIQNAQLYADAQAQAWISTMLLQVAEASQAISTVNDLLASMIRMARLLVGVHACSFLLRDEGLEGYALTAWYGFEGPINTERVVFSAQAPALIRLDETRKPLLLCDPANELQLSQTQRQFGEGSILLLPMQVRGELMGALAVTLQIEALPGEAPAFDPKTLAILQGIAHQTAVTVDNLRLVEARQEEAYVTAALLQVAQTVVSINDLEEIFDTVLHMLPILVGIDQCVLYLWDASEQSFVPAKAQVHSEAEQPQAYLPGSHALLDQVFQTGRPWILPLTPDQLSFDSWSRLSPLPLADDSAAPPPDGDWVVGLPLSVQGDHIGVMLVRETEANRAFWHKRMEIITGIATQIALAVQSERLKEEMLVNERVEREFQLARQIQQAFLPSQLPQPKGWELAGLWKTARQVGGDFYDAFYLPHNRLGLVIADVSDKGLPASLYMTVTRTLIRAAVAELASPTAVLQRVNDLLLSDSPESLFITVVYAVLSLDTGELIYANAGHNLPLWFHANEKTVTDLPKGGVVLGILEDLRLQDHTLHIPPGDGIVFFTDGVPDTLNPEEESFGMERLYNVVKEKCCLPAAVLVDAVQTELEDFRHKAPRVDDVTVLVLRRVEANGDGS